MGKFKVVVLGGGASPERQVSLRSAGNVFKAAESAGFDATLIDPASGLQKLDALGKKVVVLPILHGKGGEDGSIQSELEKRGLPYLGADSNASKICFDKWPMRQRLLENSLPMAKGELVTKENYAQAQLVKQPHVLKVCRGGSSIGTYIVRNPAQIDQSKVNEVFELDERAVVEELVEGVEITVPILGDEALPVIEIKPPVDGEFDYENKYNGQTQEICPPVSIDATAQRKARELSLKVHHATGCRHLSRVDLIVKPSGEMVVLEINTIPGMTDQSLYPKSARVAGIEFSELIKRFITMARLE